MSSPTKNPYSASTLQAQNALLEWTARIRFDKYELGSSFSVCLFLGEPPKDPNDWLMAPNFAGAHHAYVSGGGYGSRRSGGVDVDEGFVNLNPIVVRFSKLDSLDPKVIVPYLTSELQWGVQKADTVPVDLHSLEVVVFATPLTYPPGEMFPVPGEPCRYNSITYGKKGGSRENI